MSAVFFSGLAVLLAGGFAAPTLGRRSTRTADRVFALLSVAGCAMLGIAALHVLAGGDAWEVRATAATPGGAWVFGLDALSAVFVLAIAVVGAAAAVYGVGYLAGEHPQGRASRTHAVVAWLVAALTLVVTARAAVPFLVAWELMAIASFLLIVVEHERADVRRAGLVYLVATHAATLALIGMFAAWGAGAPDLTFAALASAPAAGRGTILLLALFAFGTKAGIVPLHFWLPGAHAAAPSHASALLSGLLIKTGVYGLLRVLALLGGAPAWYGWALLGLGVVSGVLGVVWALAQHDVKRLLAYHSVENIGIIVIGTGVGVLGTAYGRPMVAAFGYAGALLHVVNHAFFKALLFLGAGAVARAALTRSLDVLGGLARRMPVTAATFLLGSVAIVGLPPLNGFVSEWLVARSLVEAGLGDGPMRIAILALAGLGLIGGLALACFAKVNGAAFLGHPRGSGAAEAREAGPLMLGPMVALALACIGIGLLPVFALPPAFDAAAGITGAAGIAAGPGSGAVLTSLTVAALLLVLAVAAAWVLRVRLMRGRGRVVPHTWGCGYPSPTPRMQTTASSFAGPVLQPFGAAAGLHGGWEGPAYRTHPADPALDDILVPAWTRLQGAASRLRALQLGRLHVYLLYALATVVALLAYLALWRAP